MLASREGRKSYLSILAGIAYDRGLIPDVDEPVNRRVVDDAFAAPQNRAITWSHLLQQTSEWEGTLWGKPDMVDRNRDLSTEGGPLAKKGLPRPLQAPGTHWEYNDVRVNLLSLALLRLFRRPLPDVFAEAVMRPIGASAHWRWEGYRNSTVEIDGRQVLSVPGGSHWGGGVFIHAEDQARIGLLMLARGQWAGTAFFPRVGSTAQRNPARSTPITAIYGGSIPNAVIIPTHRRRVFSQSAPVVTAPG